MSSSPALENRVLNLAVVVSALGYFVDIFDLLLFGIVRVASLKDIGVPDDQLMAVGISLLNDQMLGVLVGGIFWGVLGDKRGRVSVLFGSIFLYSIANLANAFVHSVEAYSVLRFIAGLGLAGELGLAVTLVSEVLSSHHRGYATTIIASFGVLGALAAALCAQWFGWRTCYIIGGVLGLLLLLLRVRLHEPEMFKSVREQDIQRGNLTMLFKPERLRKYLALIFIGAPAWFIIGIVVTFSTEVGRALRVTGEVSSGTAILFCYGGLVVGDVASGLLSQYIKSRKATIRLFLALTAVSLSIALLSKGVSPSTYYGLCFILGLSIGYWAVIITTSAEMFGTNLRSTVTTTVPNFIRATVVPMGVLLRHFEAQLGGILPSLGLVGTLVILTAFFALKSIPETFGANLHYIEK